MPKFDSSLGTKQIQGQAMRDFSVPDEGGGSPLQHARRAHAHEVPVFDENAMRDFQSQMPAPPQPEVRELSEMEQQFLAAKKAKRDGKERLSDGAKRRIEMLIGMTRMSRVVDVHGTSFSLQTLKNKESREALVAAADYDGTVEFSFEYSKQLLARSLTQVAGVDFEQFITSSELDSKLAFVEELPQALFTRLYDEYVSLDNESRDKFSTKNEGQVKEVVEDLKK